jgi:hypothetical protein
MTSTGSPAFHILGSLLALALACLALSSCASEHQEQRQERGTYIFRIDPIPTPSGPVGPITGTASSEVQGQAQGTASTAPSPQVAGGFLASVLSIAQAATTGQGGGLLGLAGLAFAWWTQRKAQGATAALGQVTAGLDTWKQQLPAVLQALTPEAKADPAAVEGAVRQAMRQAQDAAQDADTKARVWAARA